MFLSKTRLSFEFEQDLRRGIILRGTGLVTSETLCSAKFCEAKFSRKSSLRSKLIFTISFTITFIYYFRKILCAESLCTTITSCIFLPNFAELYFSNRGTLLLESRNSTSRIAELYFSNQAIPKYTFCGTLLPEWQSNLHFCETLLRESSSHYPHKNLTTFPVFSDKPVLLKILDEPTHPS